MGRFTVLDAPLVDQTIEAHLQQIITAVRSRMQPESIILRGSFGRGEGSVVVQDGQLRSVSDYEIDVATFSPFYRSRKWAEDAPACGRGASLFAELSHQLATEFGVESGIRCVRPDVVHLLAENPWFDLGLMAWHPPNLVVTIHDPVMHGGDLSQRKIPQVVRDLHSLFASAYRSWPGYERDSA